VAILYFSIVLPRFLWQNFCFKKIATKSVANMNFETTLPQ
jgi:hypothetical protein